MSACPVGTCDHRGVEKSYFVQKINHDGSPLGDARPLSSNSAGAQPYAPAPITQEGIAAVADALGLEPQRPAFSSDEPPEVQLAEALQALVERS